MICKIDELNIIDKYIIKRFTYNDDYYGIFIKMMEKIAEYLLKWTGERYIGYSNEEDKEFFQSLFNKLHKLIDILEENWKLLLEVEREFVDLIKYTGDLYRILGYGDCNDPNKNKRIQPKYNSIYVSWSKNKDNYYIEGKLYGCKTKMYCKVDKPYYGIDLENFQYFINNYSKNTYYISRGEEREVVFITNAELIYKKVYYK